MMYNKLHLLGWACDVEKRIATSVHKLVKQVSK